MRENVKISGRDEYNTGIGGDCGELENTRPRLKAFLYYLKNTKVKLQDFLNEKFHLGCI